MEPDLCRSIKGQKQGDDQCSVDDTSPIFKHCTAIGGNIKNGKCIISEERLKELVK